MSVRVLVFPVFRKHWLFHAWHESAETASSTLKDWRSGVNLEEKLQLIGQQSSEWVSWYLAHYLFGKGKRWFRSMQLVHFSHL